MSLNATPDWREVKTLGMGMAEPPISPISGALLFGRADSDRIRMISSKPQQYDLRDVAALEAQIADLKRLVAVLQTQLADMREEKDKWQSRAERMSLVSPC